MDTPNVITEKVYCHDCGGYGGYGYGGGDAAAWMFSQNQWNNPIAMMMVMGMMRFMYGDNWQNQYNGNAEMQSRFNQLSNQISDNHNTDILNEAVKGNTARLGELANNLNVDHRAIQSGICDLRAALQAQGGDIKAGFQGLSGDVRSAAQGIQGDVRFTGERIINASLMGDKDLQATFKDCCCQSKELIQRMGYETQLGMKDQTYTLNERLTGIANGLQKGFSDLGYILAQQKGEIMLNDDRNTQKILDKMCADQTQNLRDQLAAKDRELLAANIIAGVKKTDCCGCGVA